MKDIRVGIIGVGNIGSQHAKLIAGGKIEGLTLTAVADSREKHRIWAGENLSETVSIFDKGDKLIQSGECDAVVIATHHNQHVPLVISSLEHNLHVLCEKPVGVYTKEVRFMNQMAEKSDRVFAVMFNQRTNHIYRKIREIVREGRYGELKRVVWVITDWYRTQVYYEASAWRSTWDGNGGGVLLNQSPHQLDLLQWICGMPKKVQAFCHEGKWHNIEVEDDVTAYMEFENGATGVFITSTGDCPGSNRLEITLSRAKIICDSSGLHMFALDQDEREFCFSSEEEFLAPLVHEVILETDGANTEYAGVFRAWSDGIRLGTPLIAEGKEGINSLELSNAMYLSSWLGRPVELPIDDDLFLEELDKRRKRK